MYDHTFYKQVQISRSDIKLHIKWAVSLVILHMITSIFLRALCGYIWVNILTLSPRGEMADLSLWMHVYWYVTTNSVFLFFSFAVKFHIERLRPVLTDDTSHQSIFKALLYLFLCTIFFVALEIKAIKTKALKSYSYYSKVCVGVVPFTKKPGLSMDIQCHVRPYSFSMLANHHTGHKDAYKMGTHPGDCT